jgi:predicted ATPase
MVTHDGEMPSTTRSTTSYQSNYDKPKSISSQKKASFTNKARQIAAKCIASIVLRPRARTRIPKTSDIEFAKIRRHLNRWKIVSSKVSSNRDDLTKHKLTALIRKLYFTNLRAAFASWISFGSND